jgi:hypothetical protein
MSPKNTTTELDSEALATLRQARATAAQLRNMGIQVQPLEPMPLKAEKPNIVRSEKTETYENFIEIQNLPSKGLFYHNKLHGQGLKMEDRYDFKLKSPATVEKLLKDKLKTVTRTANRFNELITRSPAKKKLAISDDKREAVSPLIAAMPTMGSDEDFEV